MYTCMCEMKVYMYMYIHVTVHCCSSDGKPGSGKKRRKSTSSSLALSKVGSPSTVFNPAAMTERQQMAYLLQMTDPQKKPGEDYM